MGFSSLFREFFNLQLLVVLFDLKCPFLSSYIFLLCPAPNEKIFEKSESSSLNLLVAQLYLFVLQYIEISKKMISIVSYFCSVNYQIIVLFKIKKLLDKCIYLSQWLFIGHFTSTWCSKNHMILSLMHKRATVTSFLLTALKRFGFTPQNHV